MKSKLTVLLTAMLISPSIASPVETELLTGDTKLACEAILCLSSGTRPSECNPSIQRYFSIHRKRMSDTIKARRDFLNL